jgi:hypothetical protein
MITEGSFQLFKQMNIFEFYMVELAVIDEGLKGIAEC